MIAGSREFKDYRYLTECIDKFYAETGITITRVLCGMCRGADLTGKQWADTRGIPVDPYPPDYDKYGPKKAPYLRNKAMAEDGDILIAFWDGKTQNSGTYMMMNLMKERNKPVYVYKV